MSCTLILMQDIEIVKVQVKVACATAVAQDICSSPQFGDDRGCLTRLLFVRGRSGSRDYNLIQDLSSCLLITPTLPLSHSATPFPKKLRGNDDDYYYYDDY